MADDDQIVEAVDNVADAVENLIESAAVDLGISIKEFFDRLTTEIKARGVLDDE